MGNPIALVLAANPMTEPIYEYVKGNANPVPDAKRR